MLIDQQLNSRLRKAPAKAIESLMEVQSVAKVSTATTAATT